MTCSMCNNLPEYEKYRIKEYNFWRIELHGNQCYLGKSLFILKRHAEDLFDITPEERGELFKIVPVLKEALTQSFRPDKFNYISLGNDVSHVHLHVIPRYKNTREFACMAFEDKRWGHNPSPYDKTFKVPDSVYKEIVNAIRSKL